MVIKVELDKRSTGGDDLDDGLEYDVDLSASETEVLSDNEQTVDQNGHGDEISSSMATEKTQGKKRKHKDNKLQDKKRLKMEMDIQQKKDLSKESSTEVITDYINQKIRQKNPDLSTLELAELYFNKSDVRSTSDFEETRNLDNLSKFINSRFKNMLPQTKPKKTKKNKNGDKTGDKTDTVETEERKFIAVVSMSALRACDVHRATKDLAGSSLKLINKNKIDVDLKLVKSTRSRVLCCTPGRLFKVLASEDSELKREEIKIAIIDNSYLDAKCQNIWDIKETTQVVKDLTKSGTKIYLY